MQKQSRIKECELHHMESNGANICKKIYVPSARGWTHLYGSNEANDLQENGLYDVRFSEVCMLREDDAHLVWYK